MARKQNVHFGLFATPYIIIMPFISVSFSRVPIAAFLAAALAMVSFLFLRLYYFWLLWFYRLTVIRGAFAQSLCRKKNQAQRGSQNVCFISVNLISLCFYIYIEQLKSKWCQLQSTDYPTPSYHKFPQSAVCFWIHTKLFLVIWSANNDASREREKKLFQIYQSQKADPSQDLGKFF